MSHEIPDVIYRIAAAATVMSGRDFANFDHLEPEYVLARIRIKRDIYEELKKQGLDINVVVNRLLENFVIAYKAFWNSYEKEAMLRPGFEPGSPARKANGGLGLNFDVYEDEWVEFAQKALDKDTFREYYKYNKNLLSGKVITEPHELANILEGKPKNWHKAVRHFMNFLIRRGYARKSELIDFFEVSKYPSGSNMPRPFSKAYTNLERIQKGLQYCRDKGREDRYIFAKLIIYSGARGVDALAILNTFNPDLVEYEDEITGQKFRNFVRYPLYQFIKSEMKLKFFAYFPKHFLKELRRFEGLQEHNIDKAEYYGGYFTPGQLRKWNENFLMDWGSRLTEYKDLQQIVDFIQGRVARNVGSRYYRYLQEKANELYDVVVEKFPL